MTSTAVTQTPLETEPRAPRAAPPDSAAPGEPRSPRPSLSPVVLWRGFKHLTRLGWPRRFAIVQFPNAPLIIAFVAGEVAKHTHGTGHAYASSTTYLALAVWAYLELVDGSNWFRRLLGLVYVALTTVHLAHALHG
jgi:hypothetical protein